MTYTLTRHVEARIQQRGMRQSDVELMLTKADQVTPDAFMMTNEAVDGEIARLKKRIQQYERLRGKKLIVEGETVITAYHARSQEQSKTLRKGRTCA